MTSPAAVPILTYHHTQDPPPKGTPMRSLWVSPAAFASQMHWLDRLGYQGLDMTALMPYVRGEKKGKVVGITFDDGYQSNFTHALPVLKHYGFSASCYVVSGLVGKFNQWDSSLGIPQAPLMTAQELQVWVNGGMEVGSHTSSHADLTQLTLTQVREELLQSKLDLEHMLQMPVTQFCYPYGHFLPKHEDLVFEAGYEAATTTHRGRANSSDRLSALPRVPVVRSTHTAQFLLKVLSGYEDSKRAK
jgi:peptidoglycan/xylan/chitin deacetylase (PgdA/CDA1 family)